jgi:hypothetical protein
MPCAWRGGAGVEVDRDKVDERERRKKEGEKIKSNRKEKRK